MIADYFFPSIEFYQVLSKCWNLSFPLCSFNSTSGPGQEGKQCSKIFVEMLLFFFPFLTNLIKCVNLGDVKCYPWYLLYLVIAIPNYNVPMLGQYCGRCYRKQEKKAVILHCSCRFSYFWSVISGILQSQQENKQMKRVSALLPVK